MARSVVPPPMSKSATPRSRSSWVSTASAEASGSSTSSSTSSPARSAARITFLQAEAAPVMMCTSASRRTPDIPTGSRIPSWSSTMNSCGRTWRISRSVGIATALAASITRSRSFGRISASLRDTAITPRLLMPRMWSPAIPAKTPRMVRPDIRSASWTAHWMDRVVFSRFTTTPRLRPSEGAEPTPMTRIPSPIPSVQSQHAPIPIAQIAERRAERDQAARRHPLRIDEDRDLIPGGSKHEPPGIGRDDLRDLGQKPHIGLFQQRHDAEHVRESRGLDPPAGMPRGDREPRHHGPVRDQPAHQGRKDDPGGVHLQEPARVHQHERPALAHGDPHRRRKEGHRGALDAWIPREGAHDIGRADVEEALPRRDRNGGPDLVGRQVEKPRHLDPPRLEEREPSQDPLRAGRESHEPQDQDQDQERAQKDSPIPPPALGQLEARGRAAAGPHGVPPRASSPTR